MNKKMHYLLRTLQITSLIIVCAIIAYQFTMLKDTSNQIGYQQTERFSYSLTNLAAAEAARYLSQNKASDLQLLIDDLSHDPIVRDATIYDNLGQILYQSEDVLALPILLNINKNNDPKAAGVIPYIAELYNEKETIGYIRITLEQEEILSLIHDYQQKSLSIMLQILMLSFVAGTIIMALFFRRLEAAYYHVIKELYKLSEKNRLDW
ncbi:MAG: membrane protein [Psychromonas sp.]|jgi:membrane protein|uniref:AhpA/YtjB family protein n=1 Tax=Psychromonas sp. TaxID=1884585 RepID=UPI0039E56B20